MTRRSSRLLIGLALLMVNVAASSATTAAHDQKQNPQDHKHGHSTGPEHLHASVPAEYAKQAPSDGIWTDKAVIAKGAAIHAAKCAVCHGNEGAGDGLAVTGLILKPASFRDKAMVAEMSPAYWFWRVSEGSAVEPYRSKGSAMPPYKNDLSVDDRWAVIAFQHSLSGHHGPHNRAEHPEMQAPARPHPEQRDARIGSPWVTRDHRAQPRGPWRNAVMRDLPQLYRELNGIDFGHAHLAETLLRTQQPERVEQARLDVLNFIFSSPSVPPDEEQIAPTVNRLAWELTKTFDWAHVFHRSLYDLFSSDQVKDKEAVYRTLLDDYLDKPEAITPHRLDHHRALWEFEESKAFRDTFAKFNTQIWAYHWLQAAVYDVQLLGDVKRQQELMPKVIAFYHGYLRRPPVEWQFMPMMPEAAPNFAKQFPEAAAIFDNLHMLHDNVDDILVRPDAFPTHEAKRAAILRVLPIYLHRNHVARDVYPEFHEPDAGGHGGHGMEMGPRPPSVHQVLDGTAPPSDQPQPTKPAAPAQHKH
jgi:mono/diheme cytochrome c family protein